MRIFRSSITLAALLVCGAAAHAQSSWPDFMPTLQPAASKSPVAAVVLPDAKVEPPAADVPADKARWSGRWSGWACRAYACDTKLVVEKVSAADATIVYAFASASVAPFTTRASAQFVGDELHATLPNGAKLKYRMRSSGDVVEFHYQQGRDWATGILSREK